MHRKVAAALLAVLALGVTSCGSGDKTLSRAELVRQVELACKEAQRSVQRQQSTSRATGGEATVHFLDAVLAGQRVIVARIKHYDGSGEAKADFATFKQAVQQRLVLFERVRAAGAARIQTAIRSAQREAEALALRIQDSASRLGIQGCT